MTYTTLPHAYPRNIRFWINKRKVKRYLRCRLGTMPSDDALYYVRPR